MIPKNLQRILEQVNRLNPPRLRAIQQQYQNLVPANITELVSQLDVVKQSWNFPETEWATKHYASMNALSSHNLNLSNLAYMDTFRNLLRVQDSIKATFPDSDWEEHVSKWSVDEELIGKLSQPSDEELVSHTIQNEDGEKSELAEEFKERLIKVNNLPIELINAIHNQPELMRKITPRQFEYYIGSLLGKLGFDNIEITPQSNDKGRDILATKIFCGIPMLFAFECKQYREDRKIGPGILRALIGTVNSNTTAVNKGVLVTTSSFTEGCQDIFLSEASISGTDFNGIVNWIQSAGTN